MKRKDIELPAGDDLVIAGTVRRPDNDDSSPGALVDLTGATVYLYVLTTDADAETSPLIVKSSPSSGITIDAGAGGTFTAVVPRATINTILGLPGKAYAYRVVVIESNNYRSTVLKGALKIV